jgi:hypothetical protein
MLQMPLSLQNKQRGGVSVRGFAAFLGNSMATHPQVALFGSMSGGWRERSVIPVLERLGVTYFNPNVGGEWTLEMGKREGEAMSNAETILMVFTNELPSFSGLAETGWAALGASQRGQLFILCLPTEKYHEDVPWYLVWSAHVQRITRLFNHYANASRRLVREHAAKFNDPNIRVVDSLEGAIAVLQERYASQQ